MVFCCKNLPTSVFRLSSENRPFNDEDEQAVHSVFGDPVRHDYNYAHGNLFQLLDGRHALTGDAELPMQLLKLTYTGVMVPRRSRDASLPTLQCAATGTFIKTVARILSAST